MKKYMVIWKLEEESGAAFMEDYNEAENMRRSLECGCGAFVEIYERFTNRYGSYYKPIY